MKRPLAIFACVLFGCATSNDVGADGDAGSDVGADVHADAHADAAADASVDAGADASMDAGADATGDTGMEPSDSSLDAIPDVDAGTDCSGVVAQPQTGLAGYWRFEETIGMVCDWSGNGHHGTLQGSGYTRGVAGPVGHALQFTGGTGAVVVPASTGLDFSTGATIELFLRVDSTSGVGGPLSRGTGNSDKCVLMDTSCGNVQLIFQQTGTTNTTSSCNLLTTGTFAHIAYVNDGTTLSLYKDGAFVASAAGGEMGAITNDLWMGQREQHIFSLVGAIDEVRWWTIARTQAQVCGDAGKVWTGTTCQ